MVKPELIFPTETIEKHPSLIGVVPPLLRINSTMTKVNIPLNISGFFEDLKSFQNEFGYDGQYHNPAHFEDVERRISKDIKHLKRKFPGEFGDREILQAHIAARSHDIVHNAYGKHSPSYTLNANQICALYGFAPNDSHMLPLIIEAMNAGIEEDNRINLGERASIRDGDEPIGLSEEEMSQIVQDAFAYRNGFDFDFRCEISGMVQATEFKRAMNVDKPGFKWPRTQMEYLLKLADIGNFCEQIDTWVETSTRVNTELPFFTGTNAREFINEELTFIDTYVKPVLDVDNQPRIIDVEGQFVPIRIPEYYVTLILEKENFLKELRAEIDTIAIAQQSGEEVAESKELKKFKEAIRPSLAKTDKRLSDPKVKVPLVSAQGQELQPLSHEFPGLKLARKILGD